MTDEQRDDIRARLDAIDAKLQGQSDKIEGVAEIFETMHHEGQLKNEVLESIVSRLALEKVWLEIAQMWQRLAVAQFAIVSCPRCAARADDSNHAG